MYEAEKGMGRYVHMCWKVHTVAAAGTLWCVYALQAQAPVAFRGRRLPETKAMSSAAQQGQAGRFARQRLGGPKRELACTSSPSQTGSWSSPDAHTQHAMQCEQQQLHRQPPASHANFQTASIPFSHANFQKDTVSAPSPVPSRQKPAFTVNNEPQLM